MNKSSDTNRLDRVIAEAKRHQEARAHSYREQALKIYPWICAHCGREFTRKNLSQLTVHHKDHDHDNNPADGSNWELLCLYCHDYEHAKYLESGYTEVKAGGKKIAPATSKPFAALKDLLNK